MKGHGFAPNGIDLIDHTYSLLKDIEKNFSIGERVVIISKEYYDSLVKDIEELEHKIYLDGGPF